MHDEYVQIQRRLNELERLESFATKITAALGGEVVSGSHETDKMTDTVADIIELKQEIQQEQEKYEAMRKQYFNIIVKLPEESQFKVIYGIYFDFKKKGKIAKELNYSYTHICRIHNKALEEVEKLLMERV